MTLLNLFHSTFFFTQTAFASTLVDIVQPLSLPELANASEVPSYFDIRIHRMRTQLLFQDFITQTNSSPFVALWPEPSVFYQPLSQSGRGFFLPTFSYNFYVTYFFQFLFGSLIFCVFLIALRWNAFNNATMSRLYKSFPVYTSAFIYSVFLFFFSVILLFKQFSYVQETDLLTQFVASGFQTLWFPSVSSEALEGLKWTLWDSVIYYFHYAVEYYSLVYLQRFFNLNDVVNVAFPYIFMLSKEFPQFFNSGVIPEFMQYETKILSNFWGHLIDIYPTLGRTQFFIFESFSIAPFFRENFAFVFSFDGLSTIFIVLTTFIISLCICVSWFSYKREFAYTLIILLFVTQFLIVIVFSTVDLILFYIAFESVLIPLFFLVGIFGSRERRIKAAYYLMFYTLFGSIPFLLGLLYIWYKTGQTNILLLEPLLAGMFSAEEITFLWFLFLPGFAFKVPLYPFHLWLPEAHVEAPTIGSVILAGLVLKLGGYGFIRFSIGLLYWGGVAYLNIIYWFCLLSMLGAILCAACQIDLKRIIAYGSISHMGLVTLCIFLGSQVGLESAMIMMLGHGFVSSALFILVGGLYERYHSRNVRYYGGLYKILPKFGTFMLCFVLFDIGVPGSPAFVAEFLAFVAVVQESIGLAVLISVPVIIGAGVSLLVCSRVLFGMNEARYYLAFPTIIANFAYWTFVQKESIIDTTSSVLDNSTKVSYAQIAQKHINSDAQDFLPNEIFTLTSLFISSAVLGIFPNFFVQFFVFDLEVITKVTSWLI